MRIKHIHLTRFKPMMHGGILDFEADFVQPLTTILARNGVGKSALLRELTPYPATRTDYDDGYKSILIEHGGSSFNITSDFSNKTGAHSFVKDGVELNPSGTTEVQKSLCEQFFPISQLIYQLSCHKYRMCDMTRSERKQLFLATYPSDLTFLADRHKRLCSQIRDFASKIKMLHGKAMELNDKLMESGTLDRLYKLKQKYEEINLALDQDLFLFNRTIADLESQTSSVPAFDLDTLYRELKSCAREIDWYRINHPELFTEHSFETEHQLAKAKSEELIAQLDNAHQQLETLSSNVENYRNQLSQDVESEQRQLEETAKHLHAALEDLDIDANLPALSESEIDTWKNTLLPKVTEWVDALHRTDGVFWLTDAIRKAQSRLQSWQEQIKDLGMDVQQLDEQIRLLNIRRQKEAAMAYPEECALVCPLKSTVQGIIQRNNEEYTKLEKSRQGRLQQMAVLEKRVDRLKTALEPSYTRRVEIGHLETLISRCAWDFLLLNGKDLRTVINNNPYEIVNQIIAITENAERRLIQKRYQEELMTVETKLSVLKCTKTPAKDILQQLINAGTSQLNEWTQRSAKLDIALATNSAKSEVFQSLVRLEKKFNRLASEHKKTTSYTLLKKQIEFLRIIVAEMRDTKRKVGEELVTLTSTLKEQESYLIRLKDEIEPSIAELTTKHDKWLKVEKALSPNRGIPKLYMIRYINNLLLRVNSYIKQVWDYDMELKYLTEDDELNFDFPVIFNRSSNIKDMNICSDGQKAMIDLAWMLAICTNRGIVNELPIKLDEIDAALSEDHKSKLVTLLTNLIKEGEIRQMFMVNHYVAMYTSLSNCDIICLSESGIILPPVYNEHAIIG